MGSKKLKAISVLGSGHVSVAHPEPFAKLVRAIGDEVRSYRKPNLEPLREQLKGQQGGRVRPYACTASCPTPCNRYYSDMPGQAYPDRTWEGHCACVGTCFQGFAEGGAISYGGLFDWQLGLYGGFEMNVLSNRYGINQWDIIMSMVPLLERAQWAGQISEMNGMPMDWKNPKFWAMFLHDMAYREGMGDALAEGGLRAASLLGIDEGFAQRYYSGWGFGGHWDAHAGWLNHLVFPYWVVSALQWSTDTRDPYSSSHGYVQNMMYWGPLALGKIPGNDITWEELHDIGERVYGSGDAVDPESGYKYKAHPAYYHDKRSVMKDCLPTDDQVFPLIYTVTSEDHYCRVGDIEGPSLDYHLFVLGTGTEWTEEDFERAAERVYTQERALCVRHWGRDRKMDESVLPAFEYEENWVNPILDQKHALDREQFLPVMDDYYRLLGWDVETGWPTEERLAELGLADVYDPMVSGAKSAKKTRPAWPEPVAIKV